MRFPTVADVSEVLWRKKQWMRANGIHDTDVRLQVYEDSTWMLRTGDASFDEDHRGYWGASSIVVSFNTILIARVAEDLIEQAEDQAVENGETIDD